jgi:Holliday junction DNA helicase RuvA
LTKLELIDTNNQTASLSSSNPNTGKALSALQALGFKVKEAEKMLNIITDHSLSTEEIIRQEYLGYCYSMRQSGCWCQ